MILYYFPIAQRQSVKIFTEVYMLVYMHIVYYFSIYLSDTSLPISLK